MSSNYLAVRPDWLALGQEEILEPDLPIVDAHHHFFDRPGWTYLASEYLADVRSGHKIHSTVYMQAQTRYRREGPANLRAAGVDYDVRVADPYSAYKEFDFAIPVGRSGDVYDRYTVRQEEMRQSISIVRQALDKLDKISAKTTYHADVPDWVLPPKEEVYNDMEALIYHFKIVMGEVEVPVGEIYHCVEGGNGELGFYIVSDGGKNPFRVHLRRPCFIYYQAFPEIIKGGMLSDAILTMSSLNVIAGELDA